MQSELEKILSAAAGEPIEVEFQPKEEFGHYTTNAAMKIAKLKGAKPRVVADDLIEKIEAAAPKGFFARLEVAGPGFINMWLTDEAVRKEFGKIAGDKKFGRAPARKDEKVIVEYSSPNMAKEMHAGHLRNNTLGEAIARIHEANGYKAVRWNYIGDWGTQFGKIIAAYKMWGAELNLKHEPIKQLEKLYIRFNQEAKEKPELEDKGREEFRKLEEGDAGNRELWDTFRTASLREIEAIYKRFGISFDEYIGESYFEEVVKTVVKRLLGKGVAEFSENAVVIKLEKYGLPPALVQKSDGASLYLTRDIAALEYRVENFHPKKLLYVIGNEQALQFEQLFAVAGLLGLDKGVDLEHVKYGLLLGKNGTKMSTREGTSISINELADQAIARTKTIVAEKNPDMSAREQAEIAETVGLGALKYFMLRENRMSDIVFDWEKILDLKGDSGPYLQYSHARLRRLISKSGEENPAESADLDELTTEHELRLMRKMFRFPEEVRRSAEMVMVNNLTSYLFELANLANRFYEDEPILTDKKAARRSARLLLAETAARVMAEGLKLLGIEAPEAI